MVKKIYQELTTKHEEKEKRKKRFLNFLDCCISLFIVSPLVVGFWKGLWNNINYYHEVYNIFPIWESLIICYILSSSIYYARDHLESFIITGNDNKVKSIYLKGLRRTIIYRIYHYIFAFSSIMIWRCIWEIIPIYAGPEAEPAVLLSLVCFIPLVMMRSVRNLVAPPVLIITDSKEFAFNFPTRYRIDGTREPGLYIFDCLFSVLVIGSLVVFVWRGLWVLLDLKLFPEDATVSAWASLIIGYAIVGITFSMQPIMKWACEKLEGFWRIIIADIFLFVSFIGTVNVWRGIWALLDIYFLPENKLLSDWLTHGVSLVLLILLNCSNSVLVRGVYIDAEEPAGQCVIFPVYYIRLFFQKERTKKQKRLNETTDRIDHNNTVLLIEKPQMNHSLCDSDMKVKTTKVVNIPDDVKLTSNEFSNDSDTLNENSNDEHRILCDDE
ncbi:uncharacterized protein [Chironomus tepperi]|uniref:uncharacterized protein isoform X3 n=1 Tax=Chironomus tepperi TaxID=113505 RepID=UPI00391EF9A1